MNDAAKLIKEAKQAIHILRRISNLIENRTPSLYDNVVYVHGDYALAREIQQRLKVVTMKKIMEATSIKAMRMQVGETYVHVFISDLPPHCRFVDKPIMLPAQDALPERSSTVREIECDDLRPKLPEEATT